MRITTWNVNSLRARLPAVEHWIRENEPDVLLMQETKCTDAEFPAMAFSALGYESAHHGEGRWNGVAIVSRVGLEDVQAGFTDAKPGDVEESRLLRARCDGVECFSLYVPNGRVVGSEHYVAKLEWLARLRNDLDRSSDPNGAVILGGDFNIAPTDLDVYDPAAFVGATHVTEPERAALGTLLSWGLDDAFRIIVPEGPGPFSWWDYRAGNFHKGFGMRIDLLLVSHALRAGILAASIDREARKVQVETKPSDHAPVVLDLEH